MLLSQIPFLKLNEFFFVAAPSRFTLLLSLRTLPSMIFFSACEREKRVRELHTKMFASRYLIYDLEFREREKKRWKNIGDESRRDSSSSLLERDILNSIWNRAVCEVKRREKTTKKEKLKWKKIDSIVCAAFERKDGVECLSISLAV